MQHDLDITTFDANTGSTMRAAINAALQALAGLSSGATAPGTTYPFQWWMDTSTTPKTLRMRNSANTSWVAMGTLSDAGAVIFTNAATAGGFTPSQAPEANQIPVLGATGEFKLGNLTAMFKGIEGAIHFGGSTHAILQGTSGIFVAVNCYNSTDAQFHYSTTGPAQILVLGQTGDITKYEIPSGSAGAAITMPPPTTIWTSGNDGAIPHSAESNLKIIRGNVSGGGVITAGSGFTVTKNGTGDYTINFSSAFTGVPTPTVTTHIGYSAVIASTAAGAVRIQTGVPANGATPGIALYDIAFSFIVVGTR